MAKIKNSKGSGLPREIVPQNQSTLNGNEDEEVDYVEESTPLEVEIEPSQLEPEQETLEVPHSPIATIKGQLF